MQRVVGSRPRTPRPKRGRRLGLGAVALSTLASTLVVVAVVPEVALAGVLIVTTTADEQIAGNGACSLREAIFNSNADNNGFPECGTGTGSDSITFNLGAPGIYTINVTTPLPSLTGSVAIHGETQPSPAAGQLSVQVTGGGGADLLDFSGTDPNSSVTGLILNGVTGTAAIVAGPSTYIQGNWIGTDSTGNAPAAIQNPVGIYVIAQNNVVIGSQFAPSAAERNVISGNGTGVLVSGNLSVPASGTIIVGNFIGTNKSGTGAVPNGTGVELSTDVHSTSIRSNVISGNTTRGVGIAGTGTQANTLVTNTIGLNLAKDGGIPNGIGVELHGGEVSDTHIGLSAGGNIISGNTGAGIVVGGDSIQNSIEGNFIGVNDLGVAFGNGGAGIRLETFAVNTTIGGTLAASQANVIANNAQGVFMSGGGNSVLGNSVRGNQIFDNVGLGIDLQPTGATNDPGDTDTGANNLQNFPDITMTIQGGILNASWSIDSGSGDSSYPITLDFYKADNAASGEGKTWIASTTASGPGTNTADPLGNAATLGVANGDYIVATATDLGGNTSEFSVPSQVVLAASGAFVVNNITDVGDFVPGNGICETGPGNATCTLRAAIQETNALAGADLVIFNVGLPTVTITPATDLPAIAGQLTIDASTQPGSNCGVSPQVLKVELDATNELTAGLLVSSGSLSLKGMAINRYQSTGIALQSGSSGNQIRCTFIGTNLAGTSALSLGSALEGIFLNGSNNNIIGGPLPGEGNLITGINNAEQISLVASSNNVIQGNILGTGFTGAIGGFNTRGMILNGDNNLVGGTGPGEGNIITGAFNEGIISFTGTGNSIRGNRIFGNGLLGIDFYDTGSGLAGVTFNHDPFGPAPAPGSPNDFQNFPVVTVATSTVGTTRLVGSLTSTPSTSFEIDAFANAACDATSFGEGGNYLGTFPVTTDASGVATFDVTLPQGVGEPFGVTTTATDMSTGSTSEFSYCRPASTPNLTWVTAQTLSSGQTTQQYITDNLQEKWFKISVNPGDKVKVQLTGAPGSAVSLHRDPNPIYNGLTNPSSAAALSAEAADFAFLPSGSLPSGSLPSGSLPSGSLPSGSLPSGSLERGFLPSGSLPSGSLPSGSLPSGSLPSGSLPSGSLPSGSLPSGSLPSGSLPFSTLPSGSLPSGSLPSGSLPSGSLPSGSLPSGSLDAYSSASRRSLMGISMDPYAQVQTIERTTFDLQEDLYVRVVGPYSTTSPFTLDITLTGGVCSSLTPIPAGLPVIASGLPTNTTRQTIVVTDQTRLPGSPAEKSAAMASLTTLIGRSDVNGVIVDLSDTARFPRVAAANALADANPACPAAKNTVAKEIKAVIDAYRKANSPDNTVTGTTLQYVVLAGGADVIPFYQVQDVAGLASEKDYVPPVKPETPSEAGLRSGLVKGQDYYGSSVDLTIGSRTLSVPDLAVGRLVDNAADISAAVTAYIATNGTVAPSTSLVTGYDFVGDAAAQVRDQFTGATLATDTLIQPPGQGATGPDTWSAEQLRTKLLARNNGVMMLSGHFSAGSLLAADYRTSLTAADISTSAANFTNSVVLALGCHGGFSLPSTDLLAGASPDPDWAKTFLRKGAAAYVAATGYAYGDTELTEYGERLFVGLTKQMRTGTGAIPMGKALVEAKRDYLASTAQLAGIDEKTIVEMTLYGLPMMKVDMPGPRLNPPAENTLPGTPATVPSGPGVAIGLTSKDVSVPTTPLTRNDVPLTNLDDAAPVATTYYSGRDGVVANPFEPILPKQINDASSAGKVLRGVAFRGGDYTDVANVIPLTTAPATEASRPHQSYSSEVFYPNQVWMPNFYDAVDGGPTRVVTVPAQYRSNSPGSTAGTMRTYSNVNLSLYYMPANWTAPSSPDTAKAAAVSAGPSVTGVSASVSGSIVTFSVNAQTDGSAGVQAVWVLYTADSGGFYGHWLPLDLTKSATDPTLWTGTLNIGATPAASMHFMVQAVNGAGLTALATNLGGYYSVAASATPPPPAAATTITLSGPSSGTYQTPQTFSATLTDSFGAPLSGQTLYFDVGGQQASALTDANGSASVTLTPIVPPGAYTAQVSSKSTTSYQTANDSHAFTVTKAVTTLTVSVPTPSVMSGQPSGITATLTNGTRALDGKSVAFVLTSGATQVVRVVATDNLGVAVLPPITTAPGAYSIKAYFSGGTVAGVTPTLVLPADDLYTASVAAVANVTITAASVLGITVVTRNADGTPYTPGTWTKQNVVVDFTCTAGPQPIATCETDRTITANGVTPASIGTVTDTGGNSATVAVGQIQIDNVLPTVTITTPPVGASYSVGQVVNASFSCSDTPSGATCVGTAVSGQPIDTATAGSKTFTVTATDMAGNVTTRSVTYNVTAANQAPVVRADMGVAGLQEIGYQSNVIVLGGSFTDADGSGPFTASVRWTPTGAFTPFVLNNNTAFIALYVYPSAGTRVATVKVCDKLGACGTDDVTIRSNVSQKVTPVRECVVDRGSATNPRYSARFGYNNPATFPIYIPTLLSAENGFNSIPFDRGQPQVFMPGNPRNVFTTTFNSGSIKWKLNGTTVTANSSSPRC